MHKKESLKLMERKAGQDLCASATPLRVVTPKGHQEARGNDLSLVTRNARARDATGSLRGAGAPGLLNRPKERASAFIATSARTAVDDVLDAVRKLRPEVVAWLARAPSKPDVRSTSDGLRCLVTAAMQTSYVRSLAGESVAGLRGPTPHPLFSGRTAKRSSVKRDAH